jgi:hypothetical protein
VVVHSTADGEVGASNPPAVFDFWTRIIAQNNFTLLDYLSLCLYARVAKYNYDRFEINWLRHILASTKP